MNTQQQRMKLVTIAALVALTGIAASCSSLVATGTADQSHALAQLAPLYAVPKFVAPGPAFDAKKVMAGKSILSIPGPTSNPWYTQGLTAMKSVASMVGYSYSFVPNSGELGQYQKGMATGIASKVSLIDLFAGPSPSDLTKEIAAAKAAGTIVAVSHNFGVGDAVPNDVANLPVDFARAGRLLADWVISKDTAAHVLVLVSDELASTASLRSGIDSEFQQYGGPNIKFIFSNVAIANWSTGLKTAVEAAFKADPKISYVICVYDSMSEFVVPAVAAAKMEGKAKIIGFNGTPFVLDMIRAGKVEMAVGECLEWTGYAIADAEMRLIGGMGTVKDMNIPLRIFTKENAAEAGIPATFSQGYGDSFKSGYQKLWGF